MKASELIKKLQEIVDNQGDLEVNNFVYDAFEQENQLEEVFDVWFSENEGDPIIIIE